MNSLILWQLICWFKSSDFHNLVPRDFSLAWKSPWERGWWFSMTALLGPIFPRLSRVSCFPALFYGRLWGFSRSCQWLSCFPRPRSWLHFYPRFSQVSALSRARTCPQSGWNNWGSPIPLRKTQSRKNVWPFHASQIIFKILSRSREIWDDHVSHKNKKANSRLIFSLFLFCL